MRCRARVVSTQLETRSQLYFYGEAFSPDKIRAIELESRVAVLTQARRCFERLADGSALLRPSLQQAWFFESKRNRLKACPELKFVVTGYLALIFIILLFVGMNVWL